MINYGDKYAYYKSLFENKLKEGMKCLDCQPSLLSRSMKYSLDIGGKRLRPVLMLAVSDVLNLDFNKITDFAVSLEFIHTYSLIHDDLPEMDNDDFRRGQPSNHKVFGTGNAVLAGDGLLNTAYSLLFGQCFNGGDYISAAKFICDCAGINGMIAGQSADLFYENNTSADEETLDFIYENKTAKLIIAAVVVPSILSGGKYYTELKAFGRELGMLFQLTDDLLDVEGTFESMGKSIGKDKKEGKLTTVKIYGLDKSKLRADIITDRCTAVLEGIDGNTDFLRSLVMSVRQRIS